MWSVQGGYGYDGLISNGVYKFTHAISFPQSKKVVLASINVSYYPGSIIVAENVGKDNQGNAVSELTQTFITKLDKNGAIPSGGAVSYIAIGY